MDEARPMEKGAGKPETPAERAERIAERIETDFGGRDRAVLRTLEATPGVPDQIAFLEQLYSEGYSLREKMQGGDGMQSKDDLDAKVARAAVLDKARTWAYHAFQTPRTPAELEVLQTQWEQAGDQFQREHIRATERVLAATNGELSLDDVKGMRDRGEIFGQEAVLNEMIEHRGDMPLERRETLQNDLAATLDRLRSLEPRVEVLAKEKTIQRAHKPDPFTRSPELQPYDDSYRQYQELRDDVIRILKEMEQSA